MRGPTSEQGTPVKKSKPAPSRRSTKRSAGNVRLTARRGAAPSAPHLCPRAAVILEAVDFHPALVDVHGQHRLATIDQCLKDVRHRGALETLGAGPHQLGVHLSEPHR